MTEENAVVKDEKDKLEYILERKAKQAETHKAEAEEYKAKYEEAMKRLEAQEPKEEFTSKQEFENFKKEQRITQFVEKNPEFSEFVDTVKEFAKTPQGSGLKTEAMFYAVAGKKLLEMGAKNAQVVQPVSNSPVNLTEGLDFRNMPREEFNALVNKARTA